MNHWHVVMPHWPVVAWMLMERGCWIVWTCLSVPDWVWLP